MRSRQAPKSTVCLAPACLDWPLRRVPNPPFPPRIGRKVYADRKFGIKFVYLLFCVFVLFLGLRRCSIRLGRFVTWDSWVMISSFVILAWLGNLSK